MLSFSKVALNTSDTIIIVYTSVQDKNKQTNKQETWNAVETGYQNSSDPKNFLTNADQNQFFSQVQWETKFGKERSFYSMK